MRRCPICGSRDAHDHGPNFEWGVKPETRGMNEQAMIGVRGQEIAWFAAHPNEMHYFRRAVPGEMPPEITADWVKVTKLDPDADRRQREPHIQKDGQFVPWVNPQT